MRRIVPFAIAALVMLAPAAIAQQYPPASGNLTVDKTVVAPGDTVHVSGTQCAPSSSVSLAFDTTSRGSTSANGQGSFSAGVQIPTAAATGVHQLKATCTASGGGTRVLAAQITVNRALPRTGASHTLRWVLTASTLVMLGLVLVVAVRRRSGRESVSV